MELIISETRRKRDWYFADGIYLCKEGEKVCSKIYGKNLVNPDNIRNTRKEIQKRLDINQRGLYRTEPDLITIELWNDWQRRQSLGKAEDNNQEPEGSPA